MTLNSKTPHSFQAQILKCQPGLAVLVICTLIISACGDSNTISTLSTPELVRAVRTPLILNNQLFELETDNSEPTRLINAEHGLMISLDVDQSTSATSNTDVNFQSHSLLPEYIAYTKDHSLWLYDLLTRREHLLFDFLDDRNINGEEYICDIQKSITVDIQSFEQNEILFKDEQFIYVKASQLPDCSNQSNFRYYQIHIEESATEEYKITQEVRNRDTDDNIISKIETNSFPILFGSKQDAEEALMYSGIPVVRLDTENFGHLGIDSTTNELKFFLSNIENDNNKQLLWSLQSEQFSQQAKIQQTFNAQSIASVEPDRNRKPSPHYFYDSILLGHGWNLVRFSLQDIFDDDRSNERQQQIETPLFQRTYDIDDDFFALKLHSSPTSDDIAFLDGDSIFSFSGINAEPLELSLANNNDSQNIDITFSNSGVAYVRQFDDMQESISTLDEANIERTLVLRNDNRKQLFTVKNSSAHFANLEDVDNHSWQVRTYDSIYRTVQDLPDSLLAPLVDLRSFPAPSESTIILQAQPEGIPQMQASAITNPAIVCFQQVNISCPSDHQLGSLQALVTNSADNRFTAISDDFGLANLDVIENGETINRYFYFDPIDTNSAPLN